MNIAAEIVLWPIISKILNLVIDPYFNANDDLIEPFHQFIWHFFGCSECATHFHEGILKRNMTAVVTPGK